MNDYQIYVAGGIIINNKKVLAVRSRKRPAFIVPGGKIEPGETPEQTLIREIKEEVGLSIKESDFKPYRTIYENAALGDFNKGKKMRMDAFLIHHWEGEPSAGAEIDEINWLDSSSLKDIELGSILKRHLLMALKDDGLIN